MGGCGIGRFDLRSPVISSQWMDVRTSLCVPLAVRQRDARCKPSGQCHDWPIGVRLLSYNNLKQTSGWSSAPRVGATRSAAVHAAVAGRGRIDIDIILSLYRDIAMIDSSARTITSTCTELAGGLELPAATCTALPLRIIERSILVAPIGHTARSAYQRTENMDRGWRRR